MCTYVLCVAGMHSLGAEDQGVPAGRLQECSPYSSLSLSLRQTQSTAAWSVRGGSAAGDYITQVW